MPGQSGRAAALATIVLLAAACASPTLNPGGTGSATTEVIATFTLRSAAFGDGDAIPRQHSCDGQDASPPLSWVGAPDDAKSLALIMDDPDAGGFVHWAAFNIEATASGALPAGLAVSPDAPPQGRNSFGRTGYGGPCPPSGTHRYVFRLLALDTMLPLSGTPNAADVLRAAEGHILAEARLTGSYRRGG